MRVPLLKVPTSPALLMVAVTVILAAVIAAFVFGMGGSVQKTKIVAITATRMTADSVAFTNAGGQDVGSLAFASVGGGYSCTNATVTTPSTDGCIIGQTVGSQVIATGVPMGTAVIVTGAFTDDTEQVLLQTTV